MKTKIVITEKALDTLKDKWLLLDTNILIDAFKSTHDFEDFFTSLKKNCHVVTTTAVAIELLRGAKNLKEMRKLKDYVEEVCEGVLPYNDIRDQSTQSLIEPELILAYGKNGKDVSYTDYLLAKILKKYNKSAFLLSHNHKDFPTNVFTRDDVVIFHKELEVKAYGIYSFSLEKYEKQLEKISKS